MHHAMKKNLGKMINRFAIATPSAYVQQFEVALQNFQDWKRDARQAKYNTTARRQLAML